MTSRGEGVYLVAHLGAQWGIAAAYSGGSWCGSGAKAQYRILYHFRILALRKPFDGLTMRIPFVLRPDNNLYGYQIL